MVWEGSQNVGHFRPHVQAPTVENVVGAHHAYCRYIVDYFFKFNGPLAKFVERC